MHVCLIFVVGNTTYVCLAKVVENEAQNKTKMEQIELIKVINPGKLKITFI